MEKSVKINLSGTLFQIEQDAYYILRSYLEEIEKRLKNSSGARETLDDIELRIAEIFQSTGGSAGVITRENVESMIITIGKPSDFDSGELHPHDVPTASYSYGQDDRERGPGKVFGEIFGIIGKLFFVVFRIFAIMFGIVFVISGFTAMLAFLFVLFVKDTGILPFHIHSNFFYVPDFLNFLVNPSLNPWICILLVLVMLLPLFALIYWGIRLIFWFRVRDGVFSLVAFVIWAISLAGLAIILTGEGFNYSERGRSVSAIFLENPPDTLFVVTAKKISDLKFNRELSFPGNIYSMYANTESRELSVRASLGIWESKGDRPRIEIIKNSSGSGRLEAIRRAESLPYNCMYNRDTVILDEYFTLPADHKWGGDRIRTEIYVPLNTIVCLDVTSGDLLSQNCFGDEEEAGWNPSDKFFRVTEEGLMKVPAGRSK